MDKFSLLIFLATCLTLAHGTVKIIDLKVPSAIESESVDEVILDCVYEVKDESGLEIKWFFNDDQPIYQWIPDQKNKKPLGFLKDRIDVNFKVSNDDKTMYRALKIKDVTTDLTGNYTCKVSSFFNEAVATKNMIVYDSEDEFELIHLEENDSFLCTASGVFPEPKMNAYIEEIDECDESDDDDQKNDDDNDNDGIPNSKDDDDDNDGIPDDQDDDDDNDGIKDDEDTDDDNDGIKDSDDEDHAAHKEKKKHCKNKKENKDDHDNDGIPDDQDEDDDNDGIKDHLDDDDDNDGIKDDVDDDDDNDGVKDAEEENLTSTEDEDDTEITEDGTYNITSSYKYEEDDLPRITTFVCELWIPGTNYKKVIKQEYYPGGIPTTLETQIESENEFSSFSTETESSSVSIVPNLMMFFSIIFWTFLQRI